MDIAIILCDNQQEIDSAKGYLSSLQATVEVLGQCNDLSLHSVEGTIKEPEFPSEFHKLGKFSVVVGKWT